MGMLTEYLLWIKLFFLLGLVRSTVKYEPLQNRPFFIAALYTSGLAFLTWYLVQDFHAWGQWLLKVLVLAATYFWLLAKLQDAGLLWWIVVILGMGLVFV